MAPGWSGGGNGDDMEVVANYLSSCLCPGNRLLTTFLSSRTGSIIMSVKEERFERGHSVLEGFLSVFEKANLSSKPVPGLLNSSDSNLPSQKECIFLCA